MNILLLPSWHISQMEPDFFTIVDKQAAALVRAGHTVTLVYTAPYSWKRVFRNKKIMISTTDQNRNGYREIIVYRPKTHLRKIDHWRRNRLGRNVLKRLFREDGRPDIVHVHTFEAGDLGIWVQNEFRIPFVLTEHFTGFARGLVTGSRLRQAANVYRNSRLNMAVSPPFRDLLTQQTGADFTVVPNMVDTEKFTLPPKTTSGVYTFVFVGMLHPKKRPVLILDAFRELRTKGIEARLILVGEGQLRGELEQRIRRYQLENDVFMTGYCSPEELPGLLQQSRCFVFPSAFETFGVAPVEALACGLPIIVTACGGPESYIREGENGFLIEPTTEDLAEAMEEAMSHRWDPETIRAYAVEHFSDSAVVDMLTEQYHKILNSRA